MRQKVGCIVIRWKSAIIGDIFDSLNISVEPRCESRNLRYMQCLPSSSSYSWMWYYCTEATILVSSSDDVRPAGSRRLHGAGSAIIPRTGRAFHGRPVPTIHQNALQPGLQSHPLCTGRLTGRFIVAVTWRSCCTPGPVSSGMGDHMNLKFCIRHGHSYAVCETAIQKSGCLTWNSRYFGL